MDHFTYGIVIVLGCIAGFIDSIAGGGGLITLPVLTTIIGPGAVAVGTNKIVGVSGALIAFLVYITKHKIPWGEAIAFCFFVGLGSFVGSHLTPLIPLAYFKYILLFTCPFILWVVMNRDLWIEKEKKHSPLKKRRVMGVIQDSWKAAITGLLCGFYDGMWGPGGGTFMLLGLLFVVKMPLLQSLAASKLANTVSASIALMSFAEGGFVRWKMGLFLATGMAFGAFLGARLASKKAARVVRPALVVASLLLVLKIVFMG